eukprot:1410456-Prymnesium_polylepis.1
MAFRLRSAVGARAAGGGRALSTASAYCGRLYCGAWLGRFGQQRPDRIERCDRLEVRDGRTAYMQIRPHVAPGIAR